VLGGFLLRDQLPGAANQQREKLERDSIKLYRAFRASQFVVLTIELKRPELDWRHILPSSRLALPWLGRPVRNEQKPFRNVPALLQDFRPAFGHHSQDRGGDLAAQFHPGVQHENLHV
jgi:hypothetical protein